MNPITFERTPATYRHWRVEIDGARPERPGAGCVATVTMAVQPDGGLGDDYQLKLNTYDLAVDIELNDIVQRLRFEHPEVGAVVVTSGQDRVFSAGANIQMLAAASHDHKVNFCKFTNETRIAIEDATESSDQVWLAAVNGVAAGGGYELALACDEIILVDDRSSTVSLPEVPLLGVLPGTGGLTRLVDKRGVRRDLADVFATRAEGVGAGQAAGLGSGRLDRAAAAGSPSTWPSGRGLAPDPNGRRPGSAGRPSSAAPTSRWRWTRGKGRPRLTVHAPRGPQPTTADEIVAAGASYWALAACRELEDAILDLRFNRPEIGTWVLRTAGEAAAVVASDEALDASRRSLVGAGDPVLLEAHAEAPRRVGAHPGRPGRAGQLLRGDAGRAGAGRRPHLHARRCPRSRLTAAPRVNDGAFPMANGLSRLASRFWCRPAELDAARAVFGKELAAAECLELGLVTFAPDDLDWDDEIRLFLEERAAFSPDALSGLEANLRFVGPETMETKIFGRLSAWQNWIFLRPNASGADGALRRYGTGSRPTYDRKRV